MNALKRARQALGFGSPSADEVTDVAARLAHMAVPDVRVRLAENGDFVREPVNPKFFVVSDELRKTAIADADISATIAYAARENTAMTETQRTMTESYRGSLETHKTTITDARARIVGETEAAEAEHNAQIERLNDEIRTRNEAHAEFVKGQNERIADANKTLSAINASLNDLDGVKPTDIRVPKGQKPTVVADRDLSTPKPDAPSVSS